MATRGRRRSKAAASCVVGREASGTDRRSARDSIGLIPPFQGSRVWGEQWGECRIIRVENEEAPVTIFANGYRGYLCAERVTRIELALSAWKAEDV